MVFAYKKSKNEGYRIYEMNLDGTGLRQLTFDAPEEAHLMARYGQRFRYEDCDPIYLPNGKIMFASTRPQRRVFCFGSTVTSLYVMDADGGNPCCISEGPVNEMSPCVLDDGQVIYTRWEYVDKGFGNVQSLWSMYPDGSHSAHVYKSDLVLPAGMVNARGIPGSSRIVTIGAPHCGLSVGPVVLVENSIDRRTPGGMTNLTPELGYPGMSPHRSGQTFGYFKEPYPLSEKCFLVSYNPRARDSEPAGYGIYVLDAWGNREELHRDPSMSCFQPTPLRPRRKPTVIPPVAEQGETEEKALGTLFMQDVYEGMTGIPRGRVRYLRVTEAIGVSWDDGWRSGQQDDGAGLQASAVSLRCDVNIKKIHGIATVHEDGSAHFTVPAGKNLFFQALDENYMELQRMRTFVNLMPGEKRSCIGCHEHRTSAPPLKSAQPTALSRPAETLRPQPGDTGPRRVHYALDIRPTLDKHCVGCHGSQEPPGDPDLDETLYYCNDANMNVTALVNASGAVVERYAYDPYGKVTILDGTTGGQTEWAADADQKSDVDNEILYCGYRFDPETGLYHVRHRYYHPTLGRWVSRDPIGYGDDMTLYGYGASSPMAWIDPSGLRESPCGPGCCPGQDDKANTDKVNRLIKDHLERGLRAGMASPGSWSAAGYLAADADRRLGADTNMEMALYKALNTGTPGILTDTFAKCIQICGVCIGTDKLGHMFQQGQVLYGIKRDMMRQGMKEGVAEKYAAAFSEWTEGLYDPGNYSKDVDKWLTTGRLPVAYTHYDLRPISEYRNRYGGSWFIDISAAGYWLERSRADHVANLSGMKM